MSNQELGVWLFLLSDAFTFAALLLAYAYLRLSSASFPTPFSFKTDILLATAMTVALLAGALLMKFAVIKANSSTSRRWLAATLDSGILFIILQIIVWLNLRNAGLSFSSLPQSWQAVWSEASPIFGATFFTLTGFHFLHVVVAVLVLFWLIVQKNKISQEKVKALRLYWNFICASWLLVLVFVYFLSIDTQGLVSR